MGGAVVVSAALWAEALSALPRARLPPVPGRVPAATAVIAAYLPNEQDVIEDTLHAVLASDYPGVLEVVLAYNAPGPLPLERRLQALAAADPRFVLMRVSGSRSKAENVNAAAVRARAALWHQRTRWAQGWHQVARRQLAPALGSGRLGPRARVGVLHLLLVRELFPWLSLLALRMIAYGLLRGDGLVLWSSTPAIVATALAATAVPAQLAATLRLAHPDIRRSRRSVALYTVCWPFYAEFKNVVSRMAQVRELRGRHHWIVTPGPRPQSGARRLDSPRGERMAARPGVRRRTSASDWTTVAARPASHSRARPPPRAAPTCKHGSPRSTNMHAAA